VQEVAELAVDHMNQLVERSLFLLGQRQSRRSEAQERTVPQQAMFVYSYPTRFAANYRLLCLRLSVYDCSCHCLPAAHREFGW
jgi:hypothetical protein